MKDKIINWLETKNINWNKVAGYILTGVAIVTAWMYFTG